MLLGIIAFLSPGGLLYAVPVTASEISSDYTDDDDVTNTDADIMISELDSLSTKLKNTSKKIKKKATELEDAELKLAAARLNEESHYKAMKERIKFMYEGGSLSLLYVLLSSGSMAEFLNNAEYVTRISDYDRNMLTDFVKVRQNVEEQQTKIKKQYDELAKLEDKMKQQKKDLTTKLADTPGGTERYEDHLKAAEAAEAAVREAKNADSDTIALMAAILECEAGVSYEGMIAVGTVIMNRVGSAKFPNTIREVIYQPGQFTPARSGKLDKVLQNSPSPSAFKAAKAVLGGERDSKVKKCLFFWASYTGHAGIIVGDNVFW